MVLNGIFKPLRKSGDMKVKYYEDLGSYVDIADTLLDAPPAKDHKTKYISLLSPDETLDIIEELLQDSEMSDELNGNIYIVRGKVHLHCDFTFTYKTYTTGEELRDPSMDSIDDLEIDFSKSKVYDVKWELLGDAETYEVPRSWVDDLK